MQTYSSNFSSPGLLFKKYGNCYIVFYQEKVVLTIGPHWPILLSFNILVLAIHLALVLLLSEFPYLKILVSLSFLYLQIVFIFCGLKNPGILFPNMDIELCSQNLCLRCGAENIGYHCSICEVCVEGHDHHCGFIGKCVAKGNLKEFQYLLSGVFICFITLVVSMAWRTWLLNRK